MNDSEQYKWSPNTPHKQLSFRLLLQLHMDIVNTIRHKNAWAARHPYKYFDLHGGYGIDGEGELGSPAIFHNVATDKQMPYDAHIFEADKEAFASLSVVTGKFPASFHVHYEDHHKLIARLDGRLYKWQFGIAYCDPSNAEIPVDVLQAIVESYPRLEIVINLAAASYKRTNCHPDWTRLNEVLQSIKQTWIVRKPLDKFQWTILVGTDWKGFPDWQSRGFAKVDSEVGQAWYEKIVYTHKEIHDRVQPELFATEQTSEYSTYKEYLKHPKFLVVRKQAMEKANWTCQVCKQVRSTEVHHLHYPKWGTFDIIDNLVPICHQCHCKIHGKDS